MWTIYHLHENWLGQHWCSHKCPCKILSSVLWPGRTLNCFYTNIIPVENNNMLAVLPFLFFGHNWTNCVSLPKIKLERFGKDSTEKHENRWVPCGNTEPSNTDCCKKPQTTSSSVCPDTHLRWHTNSTKVAEGQSLWAIKAVQGDRDAT